jgi:hypothetical protein
MNPPRLVEGRDYYVERGLFVFTAHYLKERGYCCRSGCRHCPYGYLPPSQDRAPPPDDASSDSPPR